MKKYIVTYQEFIGAASSTREVDAGAEFEFVAGGKYLVVRTPEGSCIFRDVISVFPSSES